MQSPTRTNADILVSNRDADFHFILAVLINRYNDFEISPK